MSGVEIVSVDEVATSFINVGNDVDLLTGIDVVFWDSFQDKSDESSFFVESSISTDNFVESEPGELTQDVFMGFFEGVEFGKVFDFLPFFIRGTLVEDFLIDFQDWSLFSLSIVVSFIVLLKKEGFEVDDEFEGVSTLSSNTSILDNPVLIEESKFFFEQFFDLRESRMVHQFFYQIFNVFSRFVGLGQSKNWGNFWEVFFLSLFNCQGFFDVWTFFVFKFSIDIFEVESVSI